MLVASWSSEKFRTESITPFSVKATSLYYKLRNIITKSDHKSADNHVIESVIAEDIDINPQSPLVGGGSLIDSMGLGQVCLALEEKS